MIKNFLCLFLCTLLVACSSLPDNTTPPSTALYQSDSSQLSVSVEEQRQKLGLASDETFMFLLETGVDSFVTRIALIEDAQESIDLQYYLFHSDLSGGLIVAALWQAAERGVRVRLLVDDIDLGGKDNSIERLNAHPNFEVRVFNPFVRGESRTIQYVTKLGKVTRRMHNKSFTVDGSVAILGGRNLADEYFTASEEVSFGDMDVVFAGESVKEVQQAFDLFWNNSLSYNIELLTDYRPQTSDLTALSASFDTFIKDNKKSQYVEAVNDDHFIELIKENEKVPYVGKTVVLYDDPRKIVSSRDKQEYNLAPKLHPYVTATKEELIIISPYFVPGKDGLELFQEIVDRGIKVKILTNSMMSNDVSLVHTGYSKYRKALLEMGVELHEIDSQELDELYELSNKKRPSNASKLSLHAKYYVMDRHLAFIGSFNLDPRSRNENTEIGILTKSEALGRYLAQKFDDYIDTVAFKLTLEDGDIVWTKMKDGKAIRYTKDPYSSWWDRTKNNMAKILPMESQL
ncbi:phospholipase D family protein [Vibrio aestuarianus]|uniref:Phospholipase D family protein n=1 Tax=Vibrio aestuarianus TaxID=28171 RepID=A0A9X4IRD5_9VIBR|nr:phospholipase D family protein [Vibrio aestuarianus]MDE1234292.1 phospholipase D family protein [Vibrio aestuarianus]MDE1244017.1 phospholipase D family protein [Vibrio aestuarianus]MDE1245036.1 phospholipase D family protein [Vibrio aestuarianus]MDE1264572.1 phospholipase D family protein [Vibrio aestuarianus]MDE1296611.1 phospholipase D family protein [Vibrio aestuarianus]